MDIGPGALEGRDVVVGPSREAAARVFGDQVDDAVVTTYDAFDTEVDLAAVSRISAVAGPGLPALLDHVRERGDLWPERVLVGLGPDPGGRDALEAVLAADPAVAVSAVVTSERGTVVSLDRAEDVPPADRNRLLRQLRTPAPPPPATTTLPLRPAQPAGSDPRTSLLGALRSWDRRHLVVLAAALTLIVVLVVAAILIAIGQSGAGVHGVLVTVVLALAVGQAAGLLGIGYAVWLARQTRADLHAQQDRLITRTDRLLRLAKAAAARDKEASREIAQLEKEILALGRLVARSRAEARERTANGVGPPPRADST